MAYVDGFRGETKYDKLCCLFICRMFPVEDVDDEYCHHLVQI